MNTQPDKGVRSFAGSGAVDATLRAIAGLPAPAGLEDRVKAALRREPAGREAKLVEWPRGGWARSAWARGAAAAAIVVVVAGGSWGVYSRVQPREAPIVLPHVGGAGGFSNANAVRTPKTLDVPTVRPESLAAKTQGGKKKKAPQRESSGVSATPQQSSAK